MSKIVYLSLNSGDFENGFSDVKVSLSHNNDPRTAQKTGKLPPNSQLERLLRNWQLLHEQFYNQRRYRLRSHVIEGIELEESATTSFSKDNFRDVANQLKECLQTWLYSPSMSDINDLLRTKLHEDEEIKVFIETDNEHLQRLPWHLWKFFTDYPKAEPTFSRRDFDSKTTANHRRKPRILVVWGDREEIDTQEEEKALRQLDADFKVLTEPSLQELTANLRNSQGWNIFFFAGHSSSREGGQIYLSPNNPIKIENIHSALLKAISNGLKLAIFNSCDGLGIAKDLAKLNIATAIVMKESVPNQVAQEFLKSLLQNFANGQSLHTAVREARESLEGIEEGFPCASWLPIICQNPAAEMLSWRNLFNQTVDNFPDVTSTIPITINNTTQRRIIKHKTTIIMSLSVSFLVMGIRWTGVLQVPELKVFDQMMRMRSVEAPDKKLLIVGADEEDIRTYDYPLPDSTLALLIDKLQQYKPAVIGLDIPRDKPVPKNDIISHQSLITKFEQNKNLITLCSFNNKKEQNIAPPAKSSDIQVGFVDLYNDESLTNKQDSTVRRYLISRTENAISQATPCSTPYSFGWHLAYQYLNAKKISVRPFKNDWMFGSILAKRLDTRSGGYQNLIDKGNQMLINYRNTDDPEVIAQQVTVRDILTNSKDFNPDWVKDRVVIIGGIYYSNLDVHYTTSGKMQGLYVHAHFVSQIINAVEEKRNLLWWLPQWGDWILVLSSSSLVIILTQRIKKIIYQCIALCIIIFLLYQACISILIIGGWMPFIPLTLAVIFSFLSLWIYIKLPIKQNK